MKNSGHTIHKGISCFNGYETKCDNIYDFDLTGLEIKKSFEIMFGWEAVHTYMSDKKTYKNVHLYGYIYKFEGYTENGEIRITKTYDNFYTGDEYTEEI